MALDVGRTTTSTNTGTPPSLRLGLYQDSAQAAVTNNLHVNQVNLGSENALEPARRLAFALAKAAQLRGVSESTIDTAAIDARAKE